MGSDLLSQLPEGASSDSVREQVLDVVRSRFPPEFLNRVDELVLFERLGRNHMDGIIDIQVRVRMGTRVRVP